jgi:peptidoglycan/xylan/chitin deacetylase (PgdA/CDA1 family)
VENRPQPWTKGHRYVTTFNQFRTQIAYIKEHFELVSSTDLIRKLITKEFNRNTAAIHFDDGFLNYSDLVVPFLRKQQIHSTVFLISSVLDGEIPIRNKLAFCLNSERRSYLLQTWQQMMDQSEKGRVNFSRMGNTDILGWSKQAISEELEEVVESVYELCEKKEPHPFLDRASALALKEEPYVEFGSHTFRHLMLSRLVCEQQRHEILEGHRNLEQFLGMKLMHFAYPHGGRAHFNETSEKIVREHDRMAAYSSYGGVNFEFCSTNIKRISINNHSPKEIKLSVLAAL